MCACVRACARKVLLSSRAKQNLLYLLVSMGKLLKGRYFMSLHRKTNTVANKQNMTFDLSIANEKCLVSLQ